MKVTEQIIDIVSRETYELSIARLAETADESVINMYRQKVLLEKLATCEKVKETIEQLSKISIPHSVTCNKSQPETAKTKDTTCDCNSIEIKELINKLCEITGISFNYEDKEIKIRKQVRV